MSWIFPRAQVLPGAQTPRLGGAVFAFAVHALVAVALVFGVLDNADAIKQFAAPLAVRLIEAAQPKPAVPKPPPKPAKPMKEPLPVLAVASSAAAPSSFTVPVQPPAPPAAPAITAGPALEPIVEARFDADYLSNPKPSYPAASRRLNETGTVYLRVHVGPDGAALKVEVKTSSGFERLDHSARETVTRWRFVPAKRGATAVASWVVVPIVFSLA